MSGNALEVVYWHAGVGHPGQSCVAAVVASELFIAQRGDYLVPVGRVSQDGCGDASSSGSGEQACVVGAVCVGDSAEHEFMDFFDQGYCSGAFAFGAFVYEAAGCGCCLASDGPCPGGGVEVFDAAAGDFADACCCAGGEKDDVAPPGVRVG